MLGASLIAFNSSYTPSFTATGGTETTFISSIDGFTYKVHTFTGWGQSLVITGTNIVMDSLLVGPGGDGGFININSTSVTAATGGGAGGMVYLNYNDNSWNGAGTYTVYVDNGSPSGSSTNIQFGGSIIKSAPKGQSGGNIENGAVISNTYSGGGSVTTVTATKPGGSYFSGGQGYVSGSTRRGGGGASAGGTTGLGGSNGVTATSAIVGTGGGVVTIPAGIFGATALTYGAGGGGGANTAGSVGLAGGTGAAAGSSTTTGINGTANTGGGGGGIYGTSSTTTSYLGGYGGSGIIKLRYRIA